jgi:tripartite-type tricarboxylate transporter receptor subunit TctC
MMAGLLFRVTGFRAAALRTLAALATGLSCVAAFAQPAGYPAKPVRFIAPFAAGGATDILTRLVAAHLSQELGSNFIVENRAGAGGNIGMEAIARAAPDGYTLGIGGGATMAVNPTLYSSLTYDTSKDFAPVHMLVRAPHVLIISKALAASSLSELIAYMKANPGKASFGSPGTGTTAHLYGELFKKVAGVDMTHIPYKGGNQVRQALAAGTLQLAFSTLVEAQSQVQSGAVKGVAIVGTRRAPGLPSMPTFAELGMQRFDSENWFGVIAPARVPREIITLLNSRVAAMLARPDFKARLDPLGLVPASAQSPEEFAKFIAADAKKWGAIVRELGVKVE